MKQTAALPTRLKIEKLSIERVVAFSLLVVAVSAIMIFLDVYNGYTGVWETHRSQYYLFLDHLYTIPLLLVLVKYLKHQLALSDSLLNYRRLIFLTNIVYFPVVLPYFYLELNDYNIGSSISIYFLTFGLMLNLDRTERSVLTFFFGLFYFITPILMGISYWEYPYHYMVGVALLFLFFFVSKAVNESEVIRFINDDLLESKKVKLQEVNLELINANKSIQSINQSLKESNQNLSNFASLAAHDIKAPLRTIGGFSSLLERKYADKVAREDLEYFRFINQSIKSLSTMIDQLLNFSKIPDEKSIDLELVHLKRIVEESVQLLKQEINTHELNIKIPETLPGIQGNKNLLKQLFLNLINNAVKFSKKSLPHPIIDITIKELPANKVEVSIKDNGIGIPYKDHQSIFELFKKLNGVKEYDGSGMGLALCKRIVHAHRGDIWVESEEGEGARFVFVL